jgi:hypothetical protein
MLLNRIKHFILNFILHGHVGNRPQLAEFDSLTFFGLQSI